MAAVIKVVIGCFLKVHTFSCLIFRCTWQQQRCRHCCWSHSWHTRASRLWCSHILLQKVSTISCSAHICCGQMAAWIKMPLRMEVGLSPGDFVLDGDPAPPSPKRGQSPQFSANFYCGQMAGCITMPLGMEVDLSPGHIVLDRDPAPHQKGGHSLSPTPNFRPMSVVAKWLDGSRCHLV